MAHTSVVNDIKGQARQGSVAAIIQVLNEQLADAGIRTRAMLAEGVLQLLCEAQAEDQLSQPEVVEQVRRILESLAPRGIRRVNINSRIVREQQLLWLEEITRDPEGQLLWSELITLKQPNPLARVWQDMQLARSRPRPLKAEKRRNLKQQYFWRGLMGGASLCLLVIMVGWVLQERLGFVGDVSPTPEAPAPETPAPTPGPDPFVQAVRLAEQAAVDGQQATTPAEWLDLAARWRRASDLMDSVPPGDPRYATAASRVEVYRQNSEQALARSAQAQPQEDPAQDDDSAAAESAESAE